ncbi:YcaO-like family protein [Mycobacterium sp.]|uniref:YcaO-like family protein n=1 Tax=Mycobacterium sp. TaxID=1785 RepID=UPI002BC90988|nr:YcaO-like family protein [Mycobacterium sp.]HKP42079.1 YcaO-like family protein [Mycobacterium sp.]
MRIEAEGEDVVVSPLLGKGRLCERCWRRRRAAATNPRDLAEWGGEDGDLLVAFNKRVDKQQLQMSYSQRRELDRHVDARRVNADRGRAEIPYQLARIRRDGLVRIEPVVPLPSCTTCWQDAAVAPDRRGPLNFVGETAGIVTALLDVPSSTGALPDPHVVISRLANSSLVPDRPFWTGASGKGWTARDALRSALGESVERYCANTVSAPVITARLDELNAAIHPSRLTGMSPAAAAAAGLDPTATNAWVASQPIDGSEQRWVPASAVYLNLPAQWRHRGDLPTSSNGLACGADLAGAIDSALREVIERHEFFSVWYGLTDAEDVSSDTALDSELQEAFTACGLQLRVLVLGRRNGVVVGCACCWPRNPTPDQPAFTLGLGAAHDAVAALTDAVLELAQVYRGLTWALQRPSLAGRARSLAAGNIAPVEPYDHGLLYSQRDASAVPWPFGLGAQRSLSCASAKADLGPALFVDLTPRDVLETVGWRVVRVLVPDAIPFHCGTRTIPDARLHLSPAQLAEFAGPSLHPLA